MLKALYKLNYLLTKYRDLSGITLCFVLAIAPILILKKEYLILSLNGLAWTSVGILLHRHSKIRLAVRSTINAIGLDHLDGSLLQLISGFTSETARYHRASFAFRSDSRASKSKLVENLSKVAQLAYRELPAQAVEMKLFEEQSGLGSNSLVVGVPIVISAKVSENNLGESQVVQVKGVQVLTEPITFAGNKFGILKVEIKKGSELTKSDFQVLKLIAEQAGISLVDARFTEELLRLKKLSDETSQAKTGFLANLSHELRGPLGIILNGVELVSEGLCGEVSEPLSEMLRMIRNSGNHLLDLVNDVLDYAKVEAGKVKAVPVVLSLRELLEDLCSVVRTQAHAKNHQLTLDAIDISLGVSVDKRHARQMLINLLSNAIKYTPSGGSIRVWAEKGESQIKIFVKDTGIGIAPEDHNKVFAAFERVENQYALSQIGTGLGMPLTKKLAEVNSGSVGFTSAPGEGSTFWLSLPVVKIAQVNIESNLDNEATIAQGRGETILLVDNTKDTREMIKLYLSKQGFSVLAVESGAALLSIIRSNRVDLAIIENDLPDLSGEDLVVALRSMPQTAATPTILLSSRAFVFDIERFLKLGVDICLSKPVSLAELSNTVRRLIDANSKLEQEALRF